MDKNLTYQQAKRIRKASLSDVLTDQLLFEPTVAKAVKRTVSLKFQSKVRGIQEKFDPLNIAKFLTFGSKIAPALLGKMTGRSVRDIEYFTGRNRPIRIGKGNYQQITPTPTPAPAPAGKAAPVQQSSADIGGINEQLLNIYKFLKVTRESDKKRREMESNYDEERAIESKKRNDELIKALREFRGANKPTATAKKEEVPEVSTFDMLREKLNEMIPTFSMLKNAGTWLTTLLGGPMALAGAISALILTPFALSAFEKDKIRQNPNAPEYKDNAYAMYLRGEAKSEGQAAEVNIRKATKQYPRRQVEDFVKSDFTDKELVQEFGADRKTLQQWLKDNPKRDAMYQAPVAPIAGVPQTAIPASKTSAPAATPVTPVTAPVTPAAKEQTKTNATQVPVSSSSQLNSVMAKNVEANMPKKPDTEAQSIVNNVVQGRQSQQQRVAKLSEIGVRNTEPTFLRMIMDSTRLV